MSLLLRLERKQKNSLKPFRNRIFFFLSSSFGIETINMFIHSWSSLENHTWFQTKISKIYTHFQTKKVQKPYPPPPRCQAWGLGGIPGNFWQGCAAHFSKSWRISRPDVDRNYFRLELKKKGLLKIQFEFASYSFFLIDLELIQQNKYIHTLPKFPRKPYPIPDRNEQNLYLFSHLNGAKIIPFGAAHTFMA